MGYEFTCRLCGPGGIFWAAVGGIDRAPPARDNNGPASTVAREGRGRGETVVEEKYSLALQLGPLHRGLGYKFRRFFLPCPDLQLVPAHPSPVNCSIRRNSSSSQQQSVRCAAAIPMTCWGFFAR